MFINNFSKNPIDKPIFKNEDSFSITSISEIIEGTTSLYYDKQIAHLYTKNIIETKKYYENEYKIDIEDKDKDSLYKIVNNEQIYRTDYELELFLQKVPLSNNMNVLDYGSAKGLFLRKLSKKKNIECFLFDITKNYESLWKEDFKKENFSFFNLNEDWENSIDVVSSFYVFEHVIDPIKELKKIYKVLKDNGLVYIQVPYVYKHIADFICVDHLHHYSEISLTHLLNEVGFTVLEVDTCSYDGGIIIVGKKQKELKKTEFHSNEYTKYKTQVEQMSLYWKQINQKIKTFFNDHKNSNSILYGAGFYSKYILSQLPKEHNISYIVDQNPYLHGQKLNDINIYPIDKLDNSIKTVYVGLNPKQAKEIIQNIDILNKSNINILFLEEEKCQMK